MGSLVVSERPVEQNRDGGTVHSSSGTKKNAPKPSQVGTYLSTLLLTIHLPHRFPALIIHE